MTTDSSNPLTDCSKCGGKHGRHIFWEAGVRVFWVNGRARREPNGSWALVECPTCKYTWKVLYGALAAA